MVRNHLWLIVAAAALIGGGCRHEIACTAEARSSFKVNVVDASGKQLCDASVTVRDGDYLSNLRSFPTTRAPTPCFYGGAYERKGTYSIEVRNGTKHKTIEDVKVSADECHVHTKSMTVVLDD